MNCVAANAISTQQSYMIYRLYAKRTVELQYLQHFDFVFSPIYYQPVPPSQDIDFITLTGSNVDNKD